MIMFEQVKQYKQEVKRTIQRKDDAFLAVTGPCSIFEEDETYEYGAKLEKLQKEIGSDIYIVMRTFVEKSRNQRILASRPVLSADCPTSCCSP